MTDLSSCGCGYGSRGYCRCDPDAGGTVKPSTPDATNHTDWTSTLIGELLRISSYDFRWKVNQWKTHRPCWARWMEVRRGWRRLPSSTNRPAHDQQEMPSEAVSTPGPLTSPCRHTWRWSDIFLALRRIETQFCRSMMPGYSDDWSVFERVVAWTGRSVYRFPKAIFC